MTNLRQKTRYAWALLILALTLVPFTPTFSFDNNSAGVQPQIVQADDCGKPTCP